MRKAGGTQDTDDNDADFEREPTRSARRAELPERTPRGFTKITDIQTLGAANAACNGTTVKIRGIVTGIDDLYGSNFDSSSRPTRASGSSRPRATRRATTSSAHLRRRHPPQRGQPGRP